MSNWTHVAGIIRLDDLRLDNSLPDFEGIFGKHVGYTDDWDEYYKHPERYLPCGSEGSLQMDVWINDDKSEVAAYVVAIHGDLRDHDSCDEIIDWFKSKIEPLWVRQAVITVRNECNGTKTWTYDRE